MKQNIECELAQSEGALIRALGVIERRGYKIEQLTVQPLCKSLYLMQFAVDTDRDVDILVKQLQRLIDVQSVKRIAKEKPLHEGSHSGHFETSGYQASWLAS
jgi:acetolactate synthase II small subunit